MHKTEPNYTRETQYDEGKRTECAAIYLGRILLRENFYSEITVRVRNADVNASDGFSALLFAHKTLERFDERKGLSFFTKGAHKQKHTKTRDDERQTNAPFLGCYILVVCVL